MTTDVRDLAHLARLEQERRKRRKERGDSVIGSWRDWVSKMFPNYVRESFAPHHERAFSWFWNIPAIQPDPFVLILARGGGKSTMAEIGVTMTGALKKRRYCLYIRATQEQADRSVANISTMMESSAVDRYYPDIASRQVGKYGQAKGWNRQRLRTAGGFFVDALGLDTAMRGAKIEDARPDIIVFDDLDELHDSPHMTNKKIEQITLSILPAATPNVAVFACQNLMLRDGIFARLANGTADFLSSRVVVGPIPAAYDLTYDSFIDAESGRISYNVTGGTPTWSGQDLVRIESLLRTWGPTAFLREGQHQVDLAVGGRFQHVDIPVISLSQIPPIKKRACWVDPAITNTDHSDSQAIVLSGLGYDDNIYVFYAWEARGTPLSAIMRAIKVAIEWDCPTVGIETDQGGETWRSVYSEAKRILEENENIKKFPRFRSAKAGSSNMSKFERGERALLPRYEDRSIFHVVGSTAMLEPALRRFGVNKPYDLVDAHAWATMDLDGRLRQGAGTWGRGSKEQPQ